VRPLYLSRHLLSCHSNTWYSSPGVSPGTDSRPDSLAVHQKSKTTARHGHVTDLSKGADPDRPTQTQQSRRTHQASRHTTPHGHVTDLSTGTDPRVVPAAERHGLPWTRISFGAQISSRKFDPKAPKSSDIGIFCEHIVFTLT
jgi:hypothetical protein